MAALLVLVVMALTPVALAASPAASPSAAASAPEGTPIVGRHDPRPEPDDASATKNLWNGDVVQVNFEPNGAEVGADGKELPNAGLEVTKCQVSINGELQELSADPTRAVPLAGDSDAELPADDRPTAPASTTSRS